ncbi:MAG: hypothetical protein JSS06_00165 [Proteobacteria bacterium]|nr:hypothetical protein [Pseudomonadota bacterium]
MPEQPPDKDGACPAGTVKVGTTCASVAPGTGGNAPQSGSGGSGGAGAVNKANDPREPASDGTCEAGTTKIGNKCYLTTVPGTGNGNGNGNGEGEKSGFGGACASGFTCEGDAVQCAIAREQHIRSCKMFDDPSPESQLYDQFKGKTGNQTGDLPGNDSINLAGRIDTSDALGGGGGCIQDLNVTVWNQSVTLPFSQICPYLAQLGNVLLAVSFLLALRIVTRG